VNAVDRRRAVVEHMIEEVPEAIYALSTEGVVLHWNRGAEVLFGYPADEARGQPLAALIVPEDRLDEAKHALEQARSGRPTLGRTVRRRRNGTLVPVDVSVRSVRDGSDVWLLVVRERDIQGLAETQASEAMFRGLLEAAPDAMVIVDGSGRISLVNEQLLRLFGYAREDLLGRTIEALVPERFRSIHVAHRDAYLAEPRTRPMGAGLDLHGRRNDGSEFPVEISLSPMKSEDGLLVTAAIRDISERRKVETKLRASLEEKEVLLKEIHHRVKNNLQIVSSMLSLQLDQLTDSVALERFKESQTRVRSIALFHEKLYQSKDLARIDIADYLRGLATGLFAAYGVNPDVVTLTVEAEDVSLDVDAAISCGLIVNELVSNSLKHAFPNGRTGRVRVELRTLNGEVELAVADDGVGFPDGVDVWSTGTLGLKLVSIFTEQVGGAIELDRSAGTRFIIDFPRER
jgi:PAS domain S-box-containing protein